MGVTNKEKFSTSQNQLADLAKALGHPARIAILEQLIRTNSCVCGDLVNELPLSQSTVSQHLKELKAAGIIKGSISGTSVCYCIDTEKWKEAKHIFDQFFLSVPNCCESC